MQEPTSSISPKIRRLSILLSLGLLSLGMLRTATLSIEGFSSLGPLVTPAYISFVVFLAIRLIKAGLPHNNYGFTKKDILKQVGLFIAAIIFLRFLDFALGPILENLFGSRNLDRFAGANQSSGDLIKVLLLSWTVAAFGEEFTYRIILMRSLSILFGDSPRAKIAAVVLQAVFFGLIHNYQGTAGVIGATLSGLVFGTVTVLASWSIFPAALAHGTNNTIGILSLLVEP